MVIIYAQIINCIFIYGFSYHNVWKWKIQFVSNKYSMKFHMVLIILCHSCHCIFLSFYCRSIFYLVWVFFFTFSYSLWWLKVFWCLKHKKSLWSFQNVDLYSNLLFFLLFISLFVFQSLKDWRFKVYVCTSEINITEQSVPWSSPWNAIKFVLLTLHIMSLFLSLEDNTSLIFPKYKFTSVLPGIFVSFCFTLVWK